MPKKQSFLDAPLKKINKRHLRVIITDANAQNEFLSVPVDTLQNNFQDKSCILEPGEHSFIKVKSFVNYAYAEVLNFSQVFNGIKKGLFIKKEDISDDLLKRIQAGAKKSKRLDNKFKIWFDLF